MRKFVLFLFVVSNLFAVKDMLIYPNYHQLQKRVELHRVDEIYALLSSPKVERDDKNIYLYNDHFRVIFGVSYENDSKVNQLAKDILSMSQTVWNKEIEEYGFKAPRNSDKYYIDIYIGNCYAFNEIENSYVTIDSNSYAGYATAYSDKTPYFVINPDMSLDVLKVTIAHEFFHTVQFAYGLDEGSYEINDKNTWFLEATAAMIEDEVYDSVNDYINYIGDYINNTNLSIEYHDENIEYGKVLFARYLREKYGIEFIKKIFENYDTSKTILQKIKDEFVAKGSSFENEMLEFAKWVANKDRFFEEGNLYPSAKRYSLDESINLQNYGFVLFDRGANSYLLGSNPEYLQSSFNGDKNIIEDIEKNGLILLNIDSFVLNSDIAKDNRFSGIVLKKGWNLISNIFAEDLFADEILNNNDIVFVLRDGNYFGYSLNDKINSSFENRGILMSDGLILPNEGFWIYSNEDRIVNIDKSRLADYSLDLKDGWNLISIASSAFDVDRIKEKVLIWHYNGSEWQVYSNYKNTSYKKIDKIVPLNGYFIRGE